MKRELNVAAATLGALVAVVAALPAAATDFPPVTDTDRALTQVPWEPEAPAVVLFRRATIRLKDYRKVASSYLDVQVRIKILSKEGLGYGEVALPHSRRLRLDSFSGRTVLPDGRVVPLPDDAVFKSQASKAEKLFVTKAAFPGVEVGAIIDYSYRMYWDSFYYLEPWDFESDLPTVVSDVTFVIPPNLAMQPWGRQSDQNPAHVEQNRTATGTEVRVWMEKLPSIVSETWSAPAADRTSRFMLVPTKVAGERLFDSWEGTCDAFDYGYKQILRRDRTATRRARELADGATAQGDKARVVYRFVRDEIETRPVATVGIAADSVDEVLDDGRGSPAEKALLLRAMLKAVGIDSDLVWTADRRDGQIDTAVANPWWFDRIVVAIDLEGGRVFLDPGDRDLGFGRLSPHQEGATALVYDRSKPELITLPVAPFDRNARTATLALAVDAEGKTTGTGALELTGQHAWEVLGLRTADRPSSEVWTEWIDDRFPGFEVADVAVDESVDDERVKVTWTLAERAEQVLGDEVTLAPSRPLGPVAQVFTLPSERRRTPVQLSYADRDEVDLTVTWPADWEVEVPPQAAHFTNAAGALEATAEVDPEGRRLHYHRRFDITGTDFVKLAEYRAIRALYAEVERHDAQSLVLVGP